MDKDLIAKMKEEAIRIERDQRRENEKFDKE